MRVPTFLRNWLADRAAAKRGEVRIAPHGTRGRVYARADGQPSNQPMQAITQPIGTVHLKVIRANGAVEDHGTKPIYKDQ